MANSDSIADQILRRINRWRNAGYTPTDILRRVFEAGAGELITRLSTRGAPLYKEDGDAAKYTRAIADSDSDSTLDAAKLSGSWDFTGAPNAVVHVVNGTATRTSVTLTAWVLCDLGTWLKIGTFTSVAPGDEVLITGVGYRRLFVAESAGAGGAAGTMTLNAAWA